MASIVIAAHNEEAVLGACLDSLLQGQGEGPLEIVVSANGCTDRTVAVAHERGVVVVDRAESGKAAALNAGDERATVSPRIYLDADIRVPPGGIPTLVQYLADSPQLMAVVPRRHLNAAGRPWPVRSYLAINQRLPAFRSGLFGRGLIVLSAEGRARFGAFPQLVADDLFLDSQFAPDEKAEVSEVTVTVEAPFTTKDLLRRLVRVRRGNAQMRAAATEGEVTVAIPATDRWAWFREVVIPEPRLVFAAIPYVAITLCADILARRAPVDAAWGRDESTRQATDDDKGELLP